MAHYMYTLGRTPGGARALATQPASSPHGVASAPGQRRWEARRRHPGLPLLPLAALHERPGALREIAHLQGEGGLPRGLAS